MRLLRARETVAHATAKRPADADAILDQHGERFDFVGAIPEQARIAARGVEPPQGPPVPTDGREGCFGVRRRPAFAGCADSAPPVVALEPLRRLAAVNHDPPRRAGPEAAVEIAFERVVSPRRTLKRRVQVGFHIGIRANHDAVAPGRIRERKQRFLNRSKSSCPTAAVRVVAQL